MRKSILVLLMTILMVHGLQESLTLMSLEQMNSLDTSQYDCSRPQSEFLQMENSLSQWQDLLEHKQYIDHDIKLLEGIRAKIGVKASHKSVLKSLNQLQLPKTSTQIGLAEVEALKEQCGCLRKSDNDCDALLKLLSYFILSLRNVQSQCQQHPITVIKIKGKIHDLQVITAGCGGTIDIKGDDQCSETTTPVEPVQPATDPTVPQEPTEQTAEETVKPDEPATDPTHQPEETGDEPTPDDQKEDAGEESTSEETAAEETTTAAEEGEGEQAAEEQTTPEEGETAVGEPTSAEEEGAESAVEEEGEEGAVPTEEGESDAEEQSETPAEEGVAPEEEGETTPEPEAEEEGAETAAEEGESAVEEAAAEEEGEAAVGEEEAAAEGETPAEEGESQAEEGENATEEAQGETPAEEASEEGEGDAAGDPVPEAEEAEEEGTEEALGAGEVDANPYTEEEEELDITEPEEEIDIEVPEEGEVEAEEEECDEEVEEEGEAEEEAAEEQGEQAAEEEGEQPVEEQGEQAAEEQGVAEEQGESQEESQPDAEETEEGESAVGEPTFEEEEQATEEGEPGTEPTPDDEQNEEQEVLPEGCRKVPEDVLDVSWENAEPISVSDLPVTESGVIGLSFYFRWLSKFPVAVPEGLDQETKFFVAGLGSALKFYVGKGGFHFSSFDVNGVETFRNAGHGDIEGLWVLVYVGIQNGKATGFAQIQGGDVETVEFDVNLTLEETYQLSIGGADGEVKSFNGQIARVFAFNDELYTDAGQFTQFVTDCYGIPKNIYSGKRLTIPIEKERTFVSTATFDQDSVFENQKPMLPDEYSASGWFKWEVPNDQNIWHSGFRWTTNDQATNQNFRNLGDRGLSFFVGDEEHLQGHVAYCTYTYKNNNGKPKVNDCKMVKYGSKLTEWFYVYFGYSRHLNKAYGYMEFTHEMAQMDFNGIRHFYAGKTYFYLGQDKFYPPFNGKVQGFMLNFFDGSYRTSSYDYTFGYFPRPVYEYDDSKELIPAEPKKKCPKVYDITVENASDVLCALSNYLAAVAAGHDPSADPKAETFCFCLVYEEENASPDLLMLAQVFGGRMKPKSSVNSSIKKLISQQALLQ